LTSQQHQALLTIKGFPDGTSITIGQLAEQLQVAHHTAVELVDRLTLQNLVFRETGTLDRRHGYIRLTERRLEILETLTLGSLGGTATSKYTANFLFLSHPVATGLIGLIERAEQNGNPFTNVSYYDTVDVAKNEELNPN